MLLEQIDGAFMTYSGIFKEEPITATFNYPDTEDGETEGGVCNIYINFCWRNCKK